ncbi:MAG: GNAT family protein [Candidatus Zixiibacteriota bacterium]
MLMKSKRILMRSLRRSDAKAVFSAIDASRAQLDQFMIWSPSTRSVKDTVNFIHRTFSERRRFVTLGFGIFDAETKAYIGNISLLNLRLDIRSAEIGYWIRSDRAGQGLATESSALTLRFAFEEWKAHRVILRAASDNPGSNRVAEKLGFHLDGIQRHEQLLSRGWLDLNCYSLLEEEYRALREQIGSFITK